MLFLMLRDVIGEDAFRRGIRAFWEQNQFRNASWSDLQAAFGDLLDRVLAHVDKRDVAAVERVVVIDLEEDRKSVV